MAIVTKTTTIIISLTLVFATMSLAANPFCNTADDKALCSQLTKDAKTWAEAMTNALKSVQEKANSGSKVVAQIGSQLPRNLKPQTKQSIERTCGKSYENILDNLKQCTGLVKSDPTSALRTYLSAISFSDCTDVLDQFGVSISEAKAFGSEILKLTNTLLAIAETKA